MEPSKYSGAVAPGYHNSLSALTTTDDADLEFTDLEEETFARTAWNGCRRGRFKRERALRRERETEEETDREIREIERANAGTRIQNRTQNPIAQTGERRSTAYLFSRPKKIYI